MRPKVEFLSRELIPKIVDEAVSILEKIGLEIDNPGLVRLLQENGADVDQSSGRVFFSNDMIEKALSKVPSSFCLFDAEEQKTHDFNGDNVHFTPGSSALRILDHNAKDSRLPVTADYVKYAKIMNSLDHIGAQSTAFIPSDVPDKCADSYRLYLSLLFCKKPVITGTFSIEGFHVMKDLLEIVRGSSKKLKEKPLAVFTCCPTSPFKWSDISSQNLVDCSKAFIPVELVAMPLAGMVSPVTLNGTLIQHTAENLGGVVMSQVVNSGTPILWGGSPAPFDMRFITTPMGAIETMMIDCGNNEIGKYLKMPTQAYISLSDSKLLDAQAGLETGMGAILASLSGINSISGPGMLDFENCHSLEKLVLDNEISGMCFRMIDGITPRNDFPVIPLMEELVKETHLLISSHTMDNLKLEHFFPGPVIDRTNHQRWSDEGAGTLGDRAHDIVNSIMNTYDQQPLDEPQIRALTIRMQNEAVIHGQKTLPEIKT